MRILLIILLAFIIALFTFITFFREHNIPIANLEFEKIEIDSSPNLKDYHYYYVYFSSDLELIDNLQEKHIGPMLGCFFKDSNVNKKDFTDKNYKYILGAVGNIKTLSNNLSTNNTYHYKAYVELRKYDKNILSEIDIDEKDLPEILELLESQESCLSCAVTAVTMLNVVKRYVSNTMCLPKEEVEKLLKPKIK